MYNGGRRYNSSKTIDGKQICKSRIVQKRRNPQVPVRFIPELITIYDGAGSAAA